MWNNIISGLSMLLPSVENDVVSDLSDENDSEEETTSREFTTDAAINSASFPKPDLTLYNVEQIEAQLDDFETVALVFMLYDNSLIALQELELWMNGKPKSLLYSWAFAEFKSKDWQNKFIEALCIVQNYEILKKYDFPKKALINHYLPHQAHVALHLNKVRKTIYRLCEQLTSEQTAEFLNRVRADSLKENWHFKQYPPKHLELYFLYWQTIGYISEKDYTKILRIFKTLPNCETLYNSILCSNLPARIDIPSRRISANYKQDSEQVDESQLPSTSITSQDSSKYYEDREAEIADHSNVYAINPREAGICLIINQEVFYDEFEDERIMEVRAPNKFENRHGTEADRDNLEATFRMYGFTVIVMNDLTDFEMLDRIREVTEKAKGQSSLFVCILSHGDEDVVYGVNSCHIKVRQIQNIMCASHLDGIPKVLILQSCQGNDCQKVIEESENYMTDGPTSGATNSKTPVTRDLLTFWATVPGFAAVRDKRRGSWFIQSLCTKLKSSRNNHFADICTEIINDVTSKKWKVNHDNSCYKIMTPFFISTLRKKLYLPYN